jgi:hypothetical protein
MVRFLAFLTAISCAKQAPDPAHMTATSRAAPSCSAAIAHPALASPAPPPPPLPERIPLQHGRELLLYPNDHAVVREADGTLGAESWCGANGIAYKQAAAFFKVVVARVRASNKSELADLMRFPLNVPRGGPVDRKAFLSRYHQIFSPSQVKAISRLDPNELFCRRGAIMIGRGELWAEPDEHGRYSVIAINPPVPRGGR